MKTNEQILKKLLGNSSSKISVHKKTNRVYRVDNYNFNTLLKLEDLLRNSNRSRYCKEYLTTINYDWEHALDIKKKNKIKKNKIFIEPFPNINYRQIWEYVIQKYLDGDIIIEEKKSIKNKSINSYDFFNVSYAIVSQASAYNKEKEFLDFLDSIPQNKYTQKSINYLLSVLDEWKEEIFWEELRSYKNPFDFKGYVIPEEGIISQMYEYEEKGYGKGEILFCFFFEGAKMMGGTESHDIVLENDYVGKLIFELKAPKLKEAFRLGKGKLQQFPFNKPIIKTFEIIKDIFKKFEEDDIKKSIGDILFYCLKDVLELEYFYSTEFSKEKLQHLLMLYRYLHEFIDNNDDTYACEISYVYYMNDYSSSMDIAFNGEYDYKPSSLLGMFKTIPYVIDPDLLLRDLDKSPQIYFDHNGNINYFVIFRNREIKFCKGHDLIFYNITESAVQIIENDVIINKKVYEENLAWDKWKNDKSKSLDEWYEYFLVN